MTSPKPTVRRGGFTLLELIVVVSVLSLLAGASIPVITVTINHAARKATLEEMDTLALACGEYFRDTQELPGALADLTADPGVPGWSGPYLGDDALDTKSGVSKYTVDGWSELYGFAGAGATITLTSGAQDRALATADDLVTTIDVTPIQRELTLEQLRTLNQAIRLYNATWLATDPLPANMTTVLNQLVARGYLPSSAGFTADAFGNAFEPCPAGIAPVVAVVSTSVGTCP